MTDKQRESAGRRAMRKYERNQVAKAKEIKALKRVSFNSVTKKMGVVRLFDKSRTQRKVHTRLLQRDTRLKQLGVVVI